MAFKEQVASDIAVFINNDEFADTHNLEGTECLAVVSQDLTKKRTGLASQNFDGIHGDFATIAVEKALLSKIPKQGENFHLDKKLYKVISCSDDMGILTIELGAYRGGLS